MAAIEALLTECGEPSTHATIGGRRVTAGEAYHDDCTWRDTAPDDDPWDEIIAVECSPTTRVTRRIDHHRPGDAGFGASPEEFFHASSLGQVISELAKLSLLPWTDGVTPRCLVLTAAADHCLGHAYAGRCPGVDPDELMHWRVESRAKFQGRSADEILADIAAAKVALEDADDVGLLPIDSTGTCRGCGRRTRGDDLDYCACPKVADMRGAHVPELPEAGIRYGIAYVADCLPGPDGRRKVVCSGTAEVIRAFLTSFVQCDGLVDPYGDPARGFAGAYYPA